MNLVREESLFEYRTSANKAGLTHEQTDELFRYNECTVKFRVETEARLDLITRLLDQSVLRQTNFVENLDGVKKILDLGVPEPLYALFYSTRLGLSIAQSQNIIEKSMVAYRKNVIYSYGSFNDALKSMYPAKIDPDLVVKALNIFYDETVWGMDGYLGAFADMMTFGCPYTISVNKALAYFATLQVRKGKIQKMLPRALHATSEVEFEDAFFEINTPLEHAPQPYQKRTSFNQGIRELEKLVFAKPRKGEEAAEGMWVFDPISNVWYSLGGKIEVLNQCVRHKFVQYDISKLTNEPVLVHVHPEYYEMMLAPSNEALVYPEYKEKVTKVLSATPSGADYKGIAELLQRVSLPVRPRSLILHSLGITEMTIPNDVSALEGMGAVSRDLRDEVLMEFDIEGYHTRWGNRESNFAFAQKIIGDLNTKLPSGFGLILSPYN